MNIREKSDVGKALLDIYDRLYAEFGPRCWWPAETPFEVMVGAILTQNTAWRNVEVAIENLKRNNLLSPEVLFKAGPEKIAGLILPSGYYNLKAKRMKEFLDYLFENYAGQPEKMLRERTSKLREELLNVNGIGPETADSILLYALNRPVFVVDAYTKRIFSRHGFIDANDSYEQIQALFSENLPQRTKLYNEYHALIVSLGKLFCKKNPDCSHCPLMKGTRL
jgi:endonuclease-3 related protein